jgi:NAD(P)H dehydrogenase (quinone)
MNKKVLIIFAYPGKESFGYALKESYKKGLQEEKAEVKEIYLNDLHFETRLLHGYRKEQEMEPDLIHAQELIQWAEHLVFIYPLWWALMPALLKAFIDRTFLPGFAFQYRKESLFWDKLLKGKSARLIITMDTPRWYYRIAYKNAGFVAMKKGILQFCGVQPVHISSFGPVKKSTELRRKKWIDTMYNKGKNDASR